MERKSWKELLTEPYGIFRTALESAEPPQVLAAGRQTEKLFCSEAEVEVLLLGEYTTQFLRQSIVAWAWANGVKIRIREGEFDQLLQELQQLEQWPGIVILLPSTRRALASPTDAIEQELAFLGACWQQTQRLKAKLIQFNYAFLHQGPQGFSHSSRSGLLRLQNDLNNTVSENLPPGSFLIDLPNMASQLGKRAFFDQRNYHWLRQPFSSAGLAEMGRHVGNAIRLLQRGRRKVLALDLDGTLWGGVVGEVGPHGVTLGGTGEGEAFQDFQRWCKDLAKTGILLGVVSKNNPEDALAPFTANQEMALKRDDIASFHASWDPKPQRLQAMAQELNLGTDSFVFVDDNPVERNLMRATLPEVLVLELPTDAADYIEAIENSLAFEATSFGEADAQRSAQYQQEAKREASKVALASPESYLDSLQMRAEFEPVCEVNLDRVTDLVTKTNQFNLTTRRHSREEIAAIASMDGSICFAARLQDRFGDYGLIAVILATATSAQNLHVDTWLMSCRAMGRTVEQATLNHLLNAAKQAGYSQISATFDPTTKNKPVADLLPNFGFHPSESGQWSLTISETAFQATRVS